MEEHGPPKLMAVARSVSTILGKKSKTQEKGARKNEKSPRGYTIGEDGATGNGN
jgi:hypothetical protein